jgi:hypothetical protein
MMTRVRAWLSGVVLAVGMFASDALAQRREAAGERVTTGVTKAGVDSLKRAVGMRVRLRDVTSPSWQYGTLGAADAEFVLLRGRRDDTRIQNKDLIAAQRSLGKARFNPTFAGFAIGLFGGGAIGFAIGDANRHSGQPNGSQRSVGLALGGAIGAGLGALIGAAVAPEHWRDIKLR